MPRAFEDRGQLKATLAICEGGREMLFVSVDQAEGSPAVLEHPKSVTVRVLLLAV